MLGLQMPKLEEMGPHGWMQISLSFLQSTQQGCIQKGGWPLGFWVSELGMSQVCNPRIQEAEAGSPQVQVKSEVLTLSEREKREGVDR